MQRRDVWCVRGGVLKRVVPVVVQAVVLLTRALQYSPKSDRRQAAFTVIKALRYALDRVSPAIVEQMDTTVVLPPGSTATADADGNLVVEVVPSPW